MYHKRTQTRRYRRGTDLSQSYSNTVVLPVVIHPAYSTVDCQGIAALYLYSGFSRQVTPRNIERVHVPSFYFVFVHQLEVVSTGNLIPNRRHILQLYFSYCTSSTVLWKIWNIIGERRSSTYLCKCGTTSGEQIRWLFLGHERLLQQKLWSVIVSIFHA